MYIHIATHMFVYVYVYIIELLYYMTHVSSVIFKIFFRSWKCKIYHDTEDCFTSKPQEELNSRKNRQLLLTLKASPQT